jgi:hypothetical protein
MWKKVGGKTLKEHDDPRGIGNQVNTNQIGYIYNVSECNRETLHRVIGGIGGKEQLHPRL